MFLDGIAERLRFPFSQKKASTVPVAEKRHKASKIHEKRAWEVLKEETVLDKRLATSVRNSLSVMYNEGSNLMPLTAGDQKKQNGGDNDELEPFVVPAVYDKDEKKRAFWLNPAKWQHSLTEFAEFMKCAGYDKKSGVKLKVLVHDTDNYGHEFIQVAPAEIDSQDPSKGILHSDRRSVSTFGITAHGEVSYFDSGTPSHTLGYLNPARALREITEESESWEKSQEIAIREGERQSIKTESIQKMPDSQT